MRHLQFTKNGKLIHLQFTFSDCYAESMSNIKKINPPNQSRNFRIIAGLNQKEVAFLLNIKNFGRISEWEQGLSNPSIENLIKLSIVYRTLPDQLYYELRKILVKEIEGREKILREIKEREKIKDEGG